MNKDVMIVLSDPEGSGLYNKVGRQNVSRTRLIYMQVRYGVMFDSKEAEGTKRRHQVDTVVEGM